MIGIRVRNFFLLIGQYCLGRAPFTGRLVQRTLNPYHNTLRIILSLRIRFSFRQTPSSQGAHFPIQKKTSQMTAIPPAMKRRRKDWTRRVFMLNLPPIPNQNKWRPEVRVAEGSVRVRCVRRQVRLAGFDHRFSTPPVAWPSSASLFASQQ